MPQDHIQDRNGDGNEARKGDSVSDESVRIYNLAAEWVARADRGPLPAAEAARLEQWLMEDVRHRGAYARAEVAFAYMDGRMEDALRAPEAPAPAWNAYAGMRGAPAFHVSRRRLLWMSGGIAATAAAAAATFIATRPGPAVSYGARRGEIRVVSLPDGSLMTLDTASSVAVKYEKHIRAVELTVGRALFNVAHDAVRPFTVSAGNLSVRSLGNTFAVQNADVGLPQVLVQDGMVDVALRSTRQSVRAGANTRVIASAALTVVAVDPAVMSQELAWRQGLIAFEDVSLRTAAAEFARYSDMHIVIPDPALAAVTITGLFAANNPAGFAHSAALSLGLKLDIQGQKITLLRL
jgi:transmembrane sensor